MKVDPGASLERRMNTRDHISPCSGMMNVISLIFNCSDSGVRGSYSQPVVASTVLFFVLACLGASLFILFLIFAAVVSES